MGASLGATLTPLIIGQLFPVIGPRALVFVAELALLLAIAVLVVAIVYTRGSERSANPLLLD
jgi:nitrate/nitrite transporter NarK